MVLLKVAVVPVLVSLFAGIANSQYQPNWESLDARPLPKWYDQSKIGIFITWGIFSVPSFGNEWFWKYWMSGSSDYVKFMKDQYPPSFTYQDFAKDFDAYFYDPDWWADLIADAGAKYVVIVTKHHDGFTIWPSKTAYSWNSMDVGPKRDLVGDLMLSVKTRTNVHFGVYHSLFEWFNPLFLRDSQNGFKTNDFVKTKTMPELFELVNNYQPEVIWSDGDWLGSDTYWNSTGFLAWLYNQSPVKDTVVVNDRWGINATCRHGGYWTCQDRYNPGHLVPHKWENAYTLDRVSWGYRREGVLADYISDLDVVTVIAQTVSCGGNFLLNIGPRQDGRIDPLMEERLRNMGKWLRVNGEAIYGSQPWLFQNETKIPVWYTAKAEAFEDEPVIVYAIVLAWPDNDNLYLANVKPSQFTTVTMLGYNLRTLPWYLNGTNPGIIVSFKSIRFADLPSTVAWALRIDGVAAELQTIHPMVKKNYNIQGTNNLIKKKFKLNE